MCFSEFASFTASALLIPTGIFCIKTAFDKDENYIPLACVPLAFGIQQSCEGIVWLGLSTNRPEATTFGSFAFLFFSHWFWLCWIPFLVFRLERDRKIRKICKFLALIGGIYGALLYLPWIINDNWLSAAIVQHSIEYQARYIGDSIPSVFPRFLYGSIILVPLLCSSHSSIKLFGGLITFSVLITWLLFNYAFISVWCFFAALLSIYIIYIVSKTDGVVA
jgi:hypothetical protein